MVPPIALLISRIVQEYYPDRLISFRSRISQNLEPRLAVGKKRVRWICVSLGLLTLSPLMLICLSQAVAVLCTMIFKRFSPEPFPNYSRTCMSDMKTPRDERTAEVLDLRVIRKMAKAETPKDHLGNGGYGGGRAEVAHLRYLYTRVRIHQAKIRISHPQRIHRKKSSCCFASHIASGPQNWSTWTCALCYQIGSSSKSSRPSISPCKENGGRGSA